MSTFGKHPLYRLLMRKYLYFIFVFLLPLSILIFCKACIIRRLISARKRRRQLGTNTTQRHRSSNAITLLLLSIIFIFLITQVPYFIFNVLYAYKGPKYMEKPSTRLYLGINNILSVINASSAFILYSFFGQKFREIIYTLFCCKEIDNHSDNFRMSQSFRKFTLTSVLMKRNSSYVSSIPLVKKRQRQRMSTLDEEKDCGDGAEQRLELLQKSAERYANERCSILSTDDH
ncbi:unnamed protein product [Didymodactylos carnosus]|uniref:G-protein coupled receptors family 1 profile domain-containing protein n=1 Tax=Didymodactylos carnosus TaxID=1234261 RepID=A0A8S2G6B3_9BILA|nr:unnamed protein product [Didymodactylos carnosus]CAF4478754.1 unnamed protein product [Didymodactylos carnosus]